MKVWDIRQALTAGIIEREGENTNIDGLIRLVGPYPDMARLERDLFLTREEAVAAAEIRRTKKIASVKKQLAKLENMRFQ